MADVLGVIVGVADDEQFVQGYGTVLVTVGAICMTNTIVMDNKHCVNECSGVLSYHGQTCQYE